MNAASPGRPRSAPRLGRDPLAMIEVAGPAHRLREVNDSFCRLVGETREALLGRPFVELVENGDVCGPQLDRFYETCGQARGPAGDAPERPRPLWLYALWPGTDPEAPAEGVIIRMNCPDAARREIVEMNEALLIGALRQHELREASEQAKVALEAAVAERAEQLRDSMAQLEAFSYSLAHDLRAPARAIRGLVHLALELPGSEAWHGAKLLRRVAEAAARMEDLIQDVLDLNRVASLPMILAPMDVDAFVRALVEERPELAPERVELRVEGPLPAMIGHEATFRQCLGHLLDNAAKFVATGERPRIRVWAERTPLRPPRAKGDGPGVSKKARRGVVVRLWVEDEGIGIDATHREKIFEMFERLPSAAAYAGTGIGLAIVRKAIQRMGGTVGVELGAPKGSRFWLELPGLTGGLTYASQVMIV